MRGLFGLTLLALLLAAPGAVAEGVGAAPPTTGPPARIVSLNLCSDQYAALLLPPARIVGLSPLARDPTLSLVAPLARDLPVAPAAAEAVLRLEPDLVLAGPWGARPTLASLRRLGVEVLEVPAPESLAAIAETARTLGARLGAEARAAALLSEMAATLAALPPPDPDPPRALAWAPNGFTSGPGTLTDDVLRRAGFVNHAAALAGDGYGFVPLERLLADPPDLLLAGDPGRGAGSRAEALLAHPALRRLGLPRISLPPGLLACGTPRTAEAVRRLAAWRRPPPGVAPSGGAGQEGRR